ncbi:MAG: DUF2950 domain-containing protein [Silvibacterium sp.]|nr:DUF2950 domain-containing protein [Silvibacterium sp.]
MPQKVRNKLSLAWLLALTLALPFGCKSNKSSTSGFATPDEAGNGLIAAAKAGDHNALLGIFGPDSKDLLDSGDPVQDKNSANAFVSRYDVMHRWRKMPDGSQILIVGADNFPFPIPLKKNADGQWFFDTAAGKEEILNRRVGRNELAVIDICRTVVGAQSEYYSQKHDGVKQYAQKFISDSGKQNGLYWPDAPGQPKSPVGPAAAQATADGYKADPAHHQPFHGYYFALLTRQGPDAPGGAKDYVVNGKMTGGFAVVAYPAKYGDSGVMTFIVDKDGVVLQKDLGSSTEQAAAAIDSFNPDKSWTVVD